MELTGTFSGWLRCATCGERVAVSGDFSVDFDVITNVTDDFGSYYDAYRLRHAWPPLRLVNCPTGTPDPVANATVAAGAVVWADPSAAANRLRLASEEFLTSLKVARFTRGAGKRRLTAHQRIQRLSITQAEMADALMAVKWIGNDGSHEGDLAIEDVLDGAQMLEHALSLKYGSEEDRIVRRIREVNRSKGVRRTTRPTR
jgi:hypothetical protein